MIATLSSAKASRSLKEHSVETLKKRETFETIMERLERYARDGYRTIMDEDKEFLLKTLGIFDRPATPERFMIRIRISGGILNLVQVRTLARIAQEYAQGYIDVTTRMQVELRYIRIEDIPAIFRALESIGLNSYQTGIDNFRNILIDPLEGIAQDNVIDARPIMRAMEALFLHSPEWINALPRKFNIALSGSRTNRCNLFGQDFALVLAQLEGVYGFHLYLGGRVGTLASSADIFVTPDEALPLFEAVACLFKTYGFRDNRNKNRLKFLIESVGMEAFRSAIEEQMGRSLRRSGETLVIEDHHPSRVRLTHGHHAQRVAIPAGVSNALMWENLADKLAEEGEMRLSIEQSCFICTPHEVISPNLLSVYHTHVVACTGSTHCPFGVIASKSEAIALSQALQQRVPLDEGYVRLYWSGCVKGCGVHGLGDIGFVGTKFSRNGTTHRGVDIYLGGSPLGMEGRLFIKGASIEEAHIGCAALMQWYKQHHDEGESFEHFLRRHTHHEALDVYQASLHG